MKTDSDQIQEHLPLRAKLGYGVAYIGNRSLAGIALGGAVTFFYNYKMQLPAKWTGWAWLIFAAWNALNDPILGFIEDGTRSKWGRRIPYLRFGAPIFALTFVLCWFPIWQNNNTGLFISFLLNLFLFDTAYTAIGLVTYSLPAEMCISSECRSNLIMVGSFLAAIGELIAMVVPMILLSNEDPILNPYFRPTMIFLAIFSMGCLIWASYNIKENEYTQLEESLPLTQGIVETFKNKPFLIFEGANFFFTIAQTIVFTGMYYYTNFVLDLSGTIASIPLVLVYLFSLLFLLVWNGLNKIYSLKRVFMINLLICAIASILLYFFGQMLITGFIFLVMFGIGYGGVTFNQGAINGDTIDFDEVQTGKRRETTYSGINALITKPAISLANAMFVWIIEAFGYKEDLPREEIVESTEIRKGIMLGFAIVSAVVFIIAFVFMYFYPLEGIEWNKKKVEIHKIHKQKEQEYLEYLQKQGIIPEEKD